MKKSPWAISLLWQFHCRSWLGGISCQTRSLVILAVLIGLPTLGKADLRLAWMNVQDATQTLSCTAAPGNIDIMGNGDAALSPGERLSLVFFLQNEGTDAITSLTGTISEAYPQLAVSNRNCSVPTDPPQFYWEGTNLGPMEIASNSFGTDADYFIVEAQQSLSCDLYYEFMLEVTYSDTDSCSASCTQRIPFTLPAFSLSQSFVSRGEGEILSSMESQHYPAGASNGRNIGMFWAEGAPIGQLTFSRTDFDGNLLEVPFDLGAIAPGGAYSVFWNGSGPFYEAIYPSYPGATELQYGYVQFPAVGAPITQAGTVDQTSCGSTIYASSAIYDENDGNSRLALAYDCGGDVRIQSHMAGAAPHMRMSSYSNTGMGYQGSWSSGTEDLRCSLGLLEVPPANRYYLAWEHHTVASGDSLEIRAYNASTLNPVPGVSRSISLGSGYAASPTLAVNPDLKRIAVAWVQDDGTGQKEVYLQYFNADLTPLEPSFTTPRLITDTASGYDCGAPRLEFNGHDFFLSWMEHYTTGSDTQTILIGKNRVAELWLEDPDMSAYWVVQELQMCGEWTNLDAPDLFCAPGSCYLTWGDERDVPAGPGSLHQTKFYPVSPDLPYNLDEIDDQLTGQTYEHVYHPALVSDGDTFGVAWWYYKQDWDSWLETNAVYLSTFQSDGTALSTNSPIYISSVALPAPWIRRLMGPALIVQNGQYEVFFRGETDIQRAYYTSGLWNLESLDPVTSDNSRVVDAEVTPVNGYLVAYLDQKDQPDPTPDDQGVDLYLYDGINGPVNISHVVAGRNVLEAAVAYYKNSSDVIRLAVAWVEGDATWNEIKYTQLNADFTYVNHIPNPSIQTLTSMPGASWAYRGLDVAANDKWVFVIANDSTIMYDEKLSLYRLSRDDGPDAVNETFLLAASEAPYFQPHITWSGTMFQITAVVEAGEGWDTGGPFNPVFFSLLLDPDGFEMYWPVVLSTPLTNSIPDWPVAKYDYLAARTDRGGVAVYSRDAGPFAVNLYRTLLGWDENLQQCAMYNRPPAVSTDGSYTVEFGQALDLSGTAVDNDLGDSVASRGWDLTAGEACETVDQSEVANPTPPPDYHLNLTPSLQQQYGMFQPGTYKICFIAEDTHGEQGMSPIVNLTITDTTPPSVSVNFPNGGETFHGGDHVVVSWEGYDNFQIEKWDVYICSTWPSCAPGDWTSIGAELPPYQHATTWSVPLDMLSATCRVKVVGTDASAGPLEGIDTSDGNFYVVQPTTTSYRTAILWDSQRLCEAYDPSSTTCDCAFWQSDTDCAATRDMDTKLQELAENTKVLGAVLDLTDWRNGNASVQALYSDWDANPTDPAKANAVADAIWDYLHDPATGQIAKVFTYAQYIVLTGDDRQIPFYRMADGTMQGNYSESVYPTEVAISTATPVGAALDQDYFLTDNFYSESDPESSGLDSPHEWAYQNDYAIGRLVETPDQIAGVINAFIEQDGQLNYMDPNFKTLTTGFTFVYDAALELKDAFATARGDSSVECLLENPLRDDVETNCITLAGDPTTDFYYDPAALDDDLFGATRHRIVGILSHANHYAFSTSPEADPVSDYNYCTDPSYDVVACGAAGIDAQTSTNLRGGLVYTSGCHSGLTIPNGTLLGLDLPEAMAKKGVVAYIGNTGYGWAIEHGKGLTESLLIDFTDELLDSGSIAVGKALANAKRNYYLEEKRYDVFDEKVLHELTLFGIPNYLIVTSNTRAAEAEKLPAPSGPDHGCANGICLDKALRTTLNAGLPDGMTELDLNFRFANIGPYQKVEVCEDKDGTTGCSKDTTDVYFGEYWTLNGYASGETGDAIQPKFVYNSTLSGLEHHGVLFTGGTIDTTKTDANFTPLGAVPLATPDTPNPGGGPLPSSGGFVPALRSSVSPSGSVGLRAEEDGTELNMVVHTGYCTGYDSGTKTCTEQVYQDMQFSVFYHMDSTDFTAPVVAAWDEATYASTGLSVAIPDDGSPAEAPIVIGGTLTGITDINVLVNLQHTRDEDLRIELVAPDATAVVLSEGNGGEDDDYGVYAAPDTYKYTVFDEGATVPIAEGMAPFKGTYRPEGTFAALLGDAMPVSGTWTLRVTDLVTGNLTTGEIKAWKITFNERYHDLEGQTATFKVQSSETDLYRVLVTYLDGGLATPKWQSADLTKNPVSGFWEGSATLLGNTQYMVQAVDTAGNIGQVVESGQDHSVAGSGGIKYGSTWEYAKMFTIPRGDGDPLPDAWEDQHSACLDSNATDTDGNGIPDALDDPDYDELTNQEEYTAGTDPCVADSDGDGDNDGSEDSNGKDPTAQGDGDRLTIGLESLGGGDVLITWPRATDTGAPGGTPCSPVGPGCFAVADNHAIDGHFRVYVSMDVRFDPADLAYGPDGDLLDGPYDLDQPDQREYAVLHASLPPEYQGAPVLYINAFNWDILTEPPLIETVLRSGSNPLQFTIYGRYFHSTNSQAQLCESATTCAVPVPMTESYRSTDRIQAEAPGGTTGTKYLAVQNPDGLIHIWSTPYAF